MDIIGVSLGGLIVSSIILLLVGLEGSVFLIAYWFLCLITFITGTTYLTLKDRV